MNGGARGVSIAIVAGAVFAALGLGYLISDILNPVLVAFLLAYVLDPVVGRMVGRRLSRLGAVVLVYLLFFAVAAPLVWLGASATIEGGGDLVDAVREDYYPRFARAAEERLVSFATRLDEDGNARRLVDRARRVIAEPGFEQAVARAAGDFSEDVTGFAREALRGGTRLVTFLVLVPLYAFFILLHYDPIVRVVRDHLPGRHRPRIVDVVTKIDGVFSAFFRGRLMIALIKGVLTWIALAICGVPFAFVLGMAAGVLSIIPFLGPGLALIVGAVFIVLDHPGAWGGRLVGLVFALAAIEVVEGAVLTPFILGREVGLHPIALILAILAGGELLGLYGVLLAVPLACIIRIVAAEFILPHVRALAEETPDGG